MLLSSSPKLFAGSRVLLRLSMPRHPPTALSYLNKRFRLLQAPIQIHESFVNHLPPYLRLLAINALVIKLKKIKKSVFSFDALPNKLSSLTAGGEEKIEANLCLNLRWQVVS